MRHSGYYAAVDPGTGAVLHRTIHWTARAVRRTMAREGLQGCIICHVEIVVGAPAQTPGKMLKGCEWRGG